MKKIINITLYLYLAALIACFFDCASVNSETARVPLDTRVNEQDFRTACEQMARSLIQIPQISNATKPPTIAIIGIENRSTDYIDKNIYLEKMRTILIKNAGGKMTFLDRVIDAQIEEEIAKKKDGKITTSKEGAVLGADFFLTGKIFSDSTVDKGKRYEFARYSFRLTDAATSAIVWEDEYESQVMNQKALFNR